METFFKDTEFVKSVLETMADGLMVVGRDGAILYFNPAAEAMTGYRAEEVVGRQCTVLNNDTCVFPGAPGKGWPCRLFEKGCVSRKRCTIKRKDGAVVYLLKNAVVLKNDRGESVGAVEVLTDITTLYMKEREVEELKSEILNEYGFMGLDGTSPSMRELYALIRNAASSDAPVLITGESGTGKELVAEAIHKLSRRHKGPFVKVNCAALNEYLLESELFGHVRGAFTGALRDRQGRFEAAHNGTIFLDEIGDMSPSMQAKLLRVLQEKEVERVGDHRPIKVNARLVTATNRDIHELMEKEQFREDLFYRINVIPIVTPALRQRKEDLPVLIAHFLKRIGLLNHKNLERVSPEAMEVIEEFGWPGNVRQLINALEYAAITCASDTITAADLPEYLQRGVRPQGSVRRYRNADDILALLSKFNGNRTLTARHLGISRVTLWKIMKELNISGY
ncbi:MAG: sigma-54 interaction domain-containing protein [Chloroflexota bacterium]